MKSIKVRGAGSIEKEMNRMARIKRIRNAFFRPILKILFILIEFRHGFRRVKFRVISTIAGTIYVEQATPSISPVVNLEK